MKQYIAIAALLAATSAQAGSFDVAAPIRSWHFDGAAMGPQHWNENNLGLGLEYRLDSGFFAGALAYYDSYYRTAKTAYVGYTYAYRFAGDWVVEATVRAGYIDGSGFHNWGVIPSAGVRYGKTAVELEVLPAIKNTQATVLAVMLRRAF